MERVIAQIGWQISSVDASVSSPEPRPRGKEKATSDEKYSAGGLASCRSGRMSAAQWKSWSGSSLHCVHSSCPRSIERVQMQEVGG